MNVCGMKSYDWLNACLIPWCLMNVIKLHDAAGGSYLAASVSKMTELSEWMTVLKKIVKETEWSTI